MTMDGDIVDLRIKREPVDWDTTKHNHQNECSGPPMLPTSQSCNSRPSNLTNHSPTKQASAQKCETLSSKQHVTNQKVSNNHNSRMLSPVRNGSLPTSPVSSIGRNGSLPTSPVTSSGMPLSASLAHHVQAAMDEVLRTVSLAPQSNSPSPPPPVTIFQQRPALSMATPTKMSPPVLVARHTNLPPLIPASVAYTSRLNHQHQQQVTLTNSVNLSAGINPGINRVTPTSVANSNSQTQPQQQLQQHVLQVVNSQISADHIKNLIRNQIENKQNVFVTSSPVIHIPNAISTHAPSSGAMVNLATHSNNNNRTLVNTDIKLSRCNSLNEPPALIQVTIPVAVNSISTTGTPLGPGTPFVPGTPMGHYSAQIPTVVDSTPTKSQEYVFHENNAIMRSSPAVVQALTNLPQTSLPVTNEAELIQARINYTHNSTLTNGSPDHHATPSPDRNLQVIKQGRQIILNSKHPIDDCQLEAVKRVLESPTDLSHDPNFHSPNNLVSMVNEPITEEAEIEDFMAKYVGDNGSRKEPAVRDLRHIIPLLIAYCFGIKDDPSQKKVKGMWYEPPSGWPADIPYVDPNNTMKGLYGDNLMGKPKKEVLMRMFEFLVRRYYSLVSGSISTDSLLTPGATILANSQDEQENSESTMNKGPLVDKKTVISSQNNNTIVMKDGCVDIEKLDKIERKVADKMRNSKPKANRSHHPYTPTSHHPAVRPIQPKPSDVVTMTTALVTSSGGFSPRTPEDQEKKLSQFNPPKDWNPADSLLQRIKEKMEYIEFSNMLNNQDLGLLKICTDLIVKFHGIYKKNSDFFVTTAHDLEATIDLVYVQKTLAQAARQKWQDFQNKWYIKIVTLANNEENAMDYNGNSAAEAMDQS